jgi:CheY-like chemotaxis protein
VLYVEDDPQSREVMSLLLVEALGWSHVTIFDHSQDFLNRIQALSPKPEIILLDIHVRPHSGFAMREMLRTLDAFRTVPVVALTASVMNEEIHQLKLAGFNGVLAKPIDQDTFGDAIQRLLKGEKIWRLL